MRVGINNPPLITKWVNDYRIADPDTLREKNKDGELLCQKPKNTENSSENAEYIRQLENDLLKLKIENAYFKD